MYQAFYLAIDLLFVLLAIMAFPRGAKHTPSPLDIKQSFEVESPPDTSIPTITVSGAESPQMATLGVSEMKVRVVSPTMEDKDEMVSPTMEDKDEMVNRQKKWETRPGTPYIKGDFPIDDDEMESDEEQST
jgi:hypothetical protein